MAQPSIRPRKPKTSADDFIDAAESTEPTKPAQETDTATRAAHRAAQGPKFGIYTLRGTESQRELIRYAAKKKGMSQNELISAYVMESLEEEFGTEVPF